MSDREEFEHIRQIAWSAVGTDIERADKALVKIHEYAKEQAARDADAEAVEFTCHGRNAPAYNCSKPGDMSGTYYTHPPAKPESEEALGFQTALKISKSVFSAYREDFPKWGGKLDGTPAQNDLPVRVAKAFQGFYAQPKPAATPNGWQLVPINPTGEMMSALRHRVDSYYNGELLSRYHEMLEAAPRAKAADEAEKDD